MMNWKITGHVLLAAGMLSLFSCCGQRNNQPRTTESILPVNQPASVSDSTKINLSAAHIDAVTILFADQGDVTGRLPEGDYPWLSRMLSTAVYDTQWNDSGIQVRMVTPDYTLIVSYKNSTPDKDDWLMIWSENGRAKFRGKWFFIDPTEREGLYRLLDRFRSTE